MSEPDTSAPLSGTPAADISAGGAARSRAPGDGNERLPAAPPIPRPRPLIAPPPDPAEALYYEGMAAYQHRNWAAALNRFNRLRELQPNRPGLPALLDEVSWFLQLEAAVPAGAPGSDAAPPAGGSTVQSGSWSRLRNWAIVVVGLIGLAALTLTLLGGRLPWSNGDRREAQELYNRGQTRLAAGDYEGAQAAFRKLLEIQPNDPEAQLGLSRAGRAQTLAQGYAAAEAAIAAEDWDEAAAELQQILAVDARYADAQARADFVARRRRLANLYTDGSRLYDLGQWENAIGQFEKIRELDNAYRAEAVAEFLFVCYLNAGEARVEIADGQVAEAQRAVEHFSSALAIHPRNRAAADARRLAALYLDAVRALANDAPVEAQARLEALLAESPDYARGNAGRQLYDLLLRRAEAALAAGDAPAAIRFYRSAQAAPVADRTAALAGEAAARAITPTPTPRPTATITPTPQPTQAPPAATVREGALNLRSGPGVAYPVVGQASGGQRLLLIGRSADSAWLRVCTDAAGGEECRGGQAGWIAASLVDVEGPLAALPVATAPPPPLPVPQPTAVRLGCVSGQVRSTAGDALAGWTVTLQPQGRPALTQRSDAGGSYRFADLTPGSYVISETLEQGWRAISPVSSVITVSPGGACVAVDFWNERTAGGGPGPTSPAPTATPAR